MNGPMNVNVYCIIGNIKSVFFWDITKCRVVIPYRRFGTTYRSISTVSKLLTDFFFLLC